VVTNIDWVRGRVSVEYDGHTSDSEVLSLVGELQADERFDGLREALHDFSKCDSCRHTEPTLVQIAALNRGARRSNDRLRIAVVATQDDVKEMIRSFVDLGRSPYPLELFNFYADADVWLRGGR
jgi:hypothetical protein